MSNTDFRIITLIAIHPKEWEAFKNLCFEEEKLWRHMINIFSKEKIEVEATKAKALYLQAKTLHERVFSAVDFDEFYAYAMRGYFDDN